MTLIIIDTQKLITDEKLFNFNSFCTNVKILIAAARENAVEIVFVRHDDGVNSELTKGRDCYEIFEDFAPTATEKIFDKMVNSPFKDSGLLEYLQQKNENDIIIAGLQTDYCIDAAVKCGFEHGFRIIVPAFANTTVDNIYLDGEKTYHYYNDFLWRNRYADCISLEDTLEIMKSKSVETLCNPY